MRIGSVNIKTKFLISGRTGSGKDFLTNHICKTLGLKKLLSYATRPKRFKNEDTHVFISSEEAQLITSSKNNIVAHTTIGEYQYFSTVKQLIESDVYIIDYNGIKYLKTNYQSKLMTNNIQFVVIYIHTQEEIKVQRAMNRINDIKIYNQRCIDEDDQFTKMESLVEYDYFINNNHGEKAKKIIDTIVKLYL